MQDKFGMNVNIGDTVIFTNGGQSETGLYFGEVMSISKDKYRNIEGVKLRKLPNGTVQQKLRYTDEIVLVLYSTEELKEIYPERFL